MGTPLDRGAAPVVESQTPSELSGRGRPALEEARREVRREGASREAAAEPDALLGYTGHRTNARPLIAPCVPSKYHTGCARCGGITAPVPGACDRG